jgi:hypothetical protein
MMKDLVEKTIEGYHQAFDDTLLLFFQLSLSSFTSIWLSHLLWGYFMYFYPVIGRQILEWFSCGK